MIYITLAANSESQNNDKSEGIKTQSIKHP
jgi:hypothetical protein